MISGLELFPGGVTGAGLLVLRFSVAGSLLMLGVFHSGDANALKLLAVLAAIGLCAGVRTRMIAGLSLAAPLFGFATGASFTSLAVLHVLDACALVLTGPGAWSTDAVSFGRRKMTLPNRDRGNR